jgi:hypothetical protein
MTSTPEYPEATGAAEPVLNCMVPGCTRPASTQMIVVAAPDEHQLPVCDLHHLELSQPGHLKDLRELAGISEQVHQPGDQFIAQAQPAQPGTSTEPGPEVVKP